MLLAHMHTQNHDGYILFDLYMYNLHFTQVFKTPSTIMYKPLHLGIDIFFLAWKEKKEERKIQTVTLFQYLFILCFIYHPYNIKRKNC